MKKSIITAAIALLAFPAVIFAQRSASGTRAVTPVAPTAPPTPPAASVAPPPPPLAAPTPVEALPPPAKHVHSTKPARGERMNITPLPPSKSEEMPASNLRSGSNEKK